METTPTIQQPIYRPQARKHAAKGEIMAAMNRAERKLFDENLSDSGFGGEYSIGGTGLRPMKDLRMDSTEKYIAKHAPSVSPSGFSGPQTSTHGGRFFGFGARSRGCPFHNTLPASDIPPEEAGDAEESQPFPAGGADFAKRKRVSKREHVRVRPEQKEPVMKKSKTVQMALMVAAWLLAGGAWAAEVKNVTAKYAWPWGVGISYEVVGTIPANDPLVVTATDRTKNVSYSSVPSALSGDTGRAAGKHQVIWDLDKQGVKIDSTNVVFTVEYRGAWCVVDLSAGANATSYPVTYLNDPPSGGFNTDAYKTTKLVLRRIQPGTFQMDTNKCQVTLTKPFYIGLFEVTQKQYQLVTGSNPSPEKFRVKSDKWPVCGVSWNTIRGNTNWPASSAVSANSFIGRLRTRTGLEFDLPTEAQWEYACRAGTTSYFNNGGNTTNDLKKVAIWTANSYGHWGYTNHYTTFSIPCYDYHPTTVGSKQANNWGIYDMHGNVYEWCLDWYGNLPSVATDPKGPTSGTYRVQRGGSYVSGSTSYSGETWYISSYYSHSRSAEDPNSGMEAGSGSSYPYTNDYFGFRLVRTPRPEEAW